QPEPHPSRCPSDRNGRSKTYELLAEGRLKSNKISKRRLIVISSYRQLVDELLAEAESPVGDGRKNPAPRISGSRAEYSIGVSTRSNTRRARKSQEQPPSCGGGR